MTLLMFQRDPDGFVIVTDTLVTDVQGVPLSFQDKVRYYPQFRMAVAGTGWGDFVVEWQRTLSERVVGRTVEDIDGWAAYQLTRLWTERTRSILPATPPTATIYHFGFGEQKREPLRFIYRSVNGFRSEQSSETGFAWKPYLDSPTGMIAAPNDLNDWVALAVRIRDEQDARSMAERIHIGGELVMTNLRPSGAQCLLLHRFDDYETDWRAMSERLECGE